MEENTFTYWPQRLIEDDYEEGDRWDWDKNDKSQYCKHGSFIGSWWGPDISCFKCEME